jgi:Lon protease-like protein
MSETVEVDFSRPMALFPLPGCVLMPHATVPLHIFEPRYRRMTRDALQRHAPIAMATFAGHEWRQNYEGTPAVRPVVCVGQIVRHERFPDGRYNMLLQGVCRARVVEEVPHEPYRTALLEPFEPAPTLEIDLDAERRQLEELLNDQLLRQLAAVSAIHNWLSDEIPTAALIDLATMTVCNNVEERYRMLSEADPVSRAHWLSHYLRDIRRTMAQAERLTPGDAPDAMHMN